MGYGHVLISPDLANACLQAMQRDLEALEAADERSGIVSVGQLGIRKMWIRGLEEAIQLQKGLSNA